MRVLIRMRIRFQIRIWIRFRIGLPPRLRIWVRIRIRRSWGPGPRLGFGFAFHKLGLCVWVMFNSMLQVQHPQQKCYHHENHYKVLKSRAVQAPILDLINR